MARDDNAFSSSLHEWMSFLLKLDTSRYLKTTRSAFTVQPKLLP
jgi:hypothetical protein